MQKTERKTSHIVQVIKLPFFTTSREALKRFRAPS